MTEQLERKIIELVATDRIFVPISSMKGKLERTKPKIAGDIIFPGNEFKGERVYARVEESETQKSKGMRDAINEFANQYPMHGAILNGLIAQQRTEREVTLYFGTNVGSKLTADDYLGVFNKLGYTERQSRNLYESLIEASRTISKKRNEERSILIG